MTNIIKPGSLKEKASTFARCQASFNSHKYKTDSIFSILKKELKLKVTSLGLEKQQ